MTELSKYFHACHNWRQVILTGNRMIPQELIQQHSPFILVLLKFLKSFSNWQFSLKDLHNIQIIHEDWESLESSDFFFISNDEHPNINILQIWVQKNLTYKIIFRTSQDSEKIFSLTSIVQINVMESLGILIFRTEKCGKDQSQVRLCNFRENSPIKFELLKW